MKTKVKKILNQRFTLWLNRRMPSSVQQTLSQRSIFILPSRFGISYLCFILLLFILGTNYQNNLIIMLSYLLGSLFITSMLYCFLNLSGLTISANGEFTGFEDEAIEIPVNLSSVQVKQLLRLNFVAHNQTKVAMVQASKTALLPVSFLKRGKYALDRMVISTEYPLGLFYCWSKLQFAIEVIVFPKPLACSLSSQIECLQDDDKDIDATIGRLTKGDDFYELKPYQVGEALNHVAWKQVAKGDIWMTKHYQQPQSQSVHLSINDMPSISIENKLRNLSYFIMKYHQSGIEFSLQLHECIGPSHGDKHLSQCLIALALFSGNDKHLAHNLR